MPWGVEPKKREESTRNHVHHGRLHLEEAPLVEEAADELDDLGPGEERGAHVLVVDDEVEVPRVDNTSQVMGSGRDGAENTKRGFLLGE